MRLTRLRGVSRKWKKGSILDEINTSPRLRIPEHPPTHSDNMRPPVPGYPPTGDALP